jgi:hypothetical protein
MRASGSLTFLAAVVAVLAGQATRGAAEELDAGVAPASTDMAAGRATSAGLDTEGDDYFRYQPPPMVPDAGAGDGGAPRVEAAAPPAPAPFVLPSYLAWTEWVRIYGFAQIDYLFTQLSQDQLDPSSGQPLNQNRIFVRRARLGAEIERPYIAGRIEFDGNTINGPTARLIDAEASIRWPGPTAEDPPLIMGTIGLFKIPFGYEIGQPDTERLFMERSIMETAFFPGEYDLGIRLKGGWRFLRYAVALMNGEPLGEKAYPGIDPNGSKDIVGRVGIVTRPAHELYVQGGISLLQGTGFHAGTVITKNVLVWQDLNNNGVYDNGETNVIPGAASVPSQNFNRFALGADLLLAYDELPGWTTTLYGEIITAQNLDRGIYPADPIAANRNLREFGYYVALTQLIATHAEVGVRYSYYNPDQDATYSVLAAPVPLDASDSTWSLTAAAVSKYGRFIVEVDLNKNHMGRDATGNPTNLASNAFIIRGEVKF